MRLFYCLELPESVRAELDRIVQPLHTADTRVTWVHPENLHVTLKFLGEVEPAKVEALEALGAAVAQKFRRFELCFDSVGAFPDIRRARVLWVGSRAAPQTVFALQQALERELAKMGFEAERHFAPHVTVGRVKEENPARLTQLAQLLGQIKPFECRMPIEALTLMESQLTPCGSIYTPVSSWELL